METETVQLQQHLDREQTDEEQVRDLCTRRRHFTSCSLRSKSKKGNLIRTLSIRKGIRFQLLESLQRFLRQSDS